jgi:hypothetical protein
VFLLLSNLHKRQNLTSPDSNENKKASSFWKLFYCNV